MRIGIDCRTILNPTTGEKAGVGHYTYYLVKHLLKLDKKNKYVLFFDHRSSSVQEFKRKQVEIIRFPFSEYKRYLPYAYSHVFVTRVLNQANLDLFHSPANVFRFNILSRRGNRTRLAIYQHQNGLPSKTFRSRC